MGNSSRVLLLTIDSLGLSYGLNERTGMHYDKSLEKRISNIPLVEGTVKARFGGSSPFFDRGVN